MAKKVWTEEDVRALGAGAELELGSAAIATPAALDLAYTRGIRVRYGKAAASGPAATALTSDPLWNAILSQDGTYVIEVKGGRASVARLTPQGPQPFGAR